MTMKKGIISVSTIVVVILGVFFALRFIGGRESATNIKPTDDSIVQSSNAALANGNEDNSLNTSQGQSGIELTQEESSNDLDTAYINEKTNVGLYTVKKDDTLFSIAKAYMPSEDRSKTVEFIKNRNSIGKTYDIEVGQKIVIPYEKSIETSKAISSEDGTTKYTIKKQDTLTSIAKNNMPSYSVKHAIDLIKETNKITDENAIKEGALIYIPK